MDICRRDSMAEKSVEKTVVKELLEIVRHMLRLPMRKVWWDYDEEADVLYVSFQRPQRATDSEMLDNGVILRYRKDKLVGVTVLNASSRCKDGV